MKNKRIFAILGKSNTGKSTIFKEVMRMIKENGDDIQVLKSCTTRPKREEDMKDNEYRFVDKEYFSKIHKENGLLEYAVYETVYGHWFYFTEKDDLNGKTDYIKIINPSGLSQIKSTAKEKGYEVVSFHIVTDDDIRLKRALSRDDGLSEKEILRRFDADKKDFNNVITDCVIINNGEKTPVELAEIIYKYIKRHN